MSVFSAIGNFFKRVFGWVVKNTDLDEFLKREFQGFVLAVIGELAQSNLDNSQKRSAAFDRIKAYSLESGYRLQDHAINLVLELAVAKLKGTIGQ